MRAGVVSAAVLLLVPGCAAQAPVAGPAASPAASPSAASTTSPSPSPTAAEHVEVSATSVAGVAVGTPADEAERQLVAELGPPAADALPGCFGEAGRALTWDALTVFLSDGGGGGPVVLRGWTVGSGPGGERLALPYGTAVGQSTDEVVARVPAAAGAVREEGPYTGSFLVTSEEAPGLLWAAAREGAAVDEMSFEPEVCD